MIDRFPCFAPETMIMDRSSFYENQITPEVWSKLARLDSLKELVVDQLDSRWLLSKLLKKLEELAATEINLRLENDSDIDALASFLSSSNIRLRIDYVWRPFYGNFNEPD